MQTALHATPGYADDVVSLLLDAATGDAQTAFAIAGLQGSGKSTLAAQIAAAAGQRDLRAVVLSIDDFYLDRPARLQLGRDVHPLLATRGPPGTHDVALACNVIDALLQHRAVALPRFDKIADVRLPESTWPRIGRCDLVIFEGWFLHVPAQDEAALQAPLNTLERDEDPEGTWRRFCNDSLRTDYASLWSRLPRTVFLQAPTFDVVPGWRWQQELTLHAASEGRDVMSRAQVDRFVQLFERTSRQALRTLPALVDAVIRLDAQRQPDPRDLAALAAALRPAPTIGA